MTKDKTQLKSPDDPQTSGKACKMPEDNAQLTCDDSTEEEADDMESMDSMVIKLVFQYVWIVFCFVMYAIKGAKICACTE